MARSISPPTTRTTLQETTVLFARFTLPEEPLPPSLLTALRTRLEAVVRRYDGVMDQRYQAREDVLVALFGVPVPHQEDAKRAIRAALTMQAEMGTFPDQEFPPRLQIGLNTGMVTLHLSAQGEYGAKGEAIETARLLSRTINANEIVISQDTYRRTVGMFETYPLDSPRVEGQALSLLVYRVVGERALGLRQPQGAREGFRSTLVGRTAELAQLQEIFNRVVESGQLQVVTLLGEAGIGKSRLLQAFSEWVEGQSETVRFFKGRANPHISSQPYALIRDIFAFRFGIREGEAVMARAKLEQGIRKFMGAEGTEKAHLIGHLLGFDFSESPYLRGTISEARHLRDRAFHAITLFFEALTSERRDAVRVLKLMSSGLDRPLVVTLLEDVHWADDGSLDLLEHVVKSCRQVPMILLVTARPHFQSQRPSWGRRWPARYHTILEVGPLSEAEERLLVDNLLERVEGVPESLRALLVKQTAGNPFYMEAMLKLLAEEGAIVAPRGANQWDMDLERLAQLKIPPTLTGVMEARVARLLPLEREILQRAAVVGRIFWDGALEALAGDSTAAAYEVQVALQGLQERELIVERQLSTFDGLREFVFRHTLVQDVAYQSLSAALRKDHHARLAAWLVQQTGEQRAEEFAGQIAQHYELAGDEEQAAIWYGRAGQGAQESSIPQSALTYYERALSLMPEREETMAQRLQWLEGRGEMLRQQGLYKEAIESFLQVNEAAEALGAHTVQVASLNNLAMTYDIQQAHQQALTYAEQARQIASHLGEEANSERATALWLLGVSHYRIGKLEQAQQWAEQAWELASELNAQRIMARCQSLLGWVHGAAGRYEEATLALRRSLSLFRKMEDQQGIGTILNNLGVSAADQGDYRSALPLYQEALEIAQELGAHNLESYILVNLGGTHVRLGDYQQGEVELREAIDRSEEGQGTSEAYRFLAEALLGQGRASEAGGTIQHALLVAHATGRKEHLALAWRTMGRLLCAHPTLFQEGEVELLDAASELLGNVSKLTTTTCFKQSLRLLEEIGLEAERARTLRAWARCALDQGKQAAGQAMWQEAADIFTRLGLKIELTRME